MPPEEVGLQQGPHAQLVVVHRGHRAACSAALSACCQQPAALMAVHRCHPMQTCTVHSWHERPPHAAGSALIDWLTGLSHNWMS